MTELRRIGVAVLTYRRPELLQEALASLQRQSILASTEYLLHILVVDNDAALSGRFAFLAAQDRAVEEGSSAAMQYCAEPVRGLASARNRAVAELQTADFIAFIDDDETAAPNWLEELLRVQEQHGSDVVCGPVEPRFHQPPTWILRGGFFAARHMPTGSDVRWAETNNVLFRAALGQEFQFDERFNTSGGEDADFFGRIRLAGYKLVWADDAVVYESILPERMTPRWLTRRAYSDAYRLTRILVLFDPAWKTVFIRIFKGLVLIVWGCLSLPLGLLGRERMVHALRLIARAQGTWSALLKRPHVFYGPVQVAAKEAE